MAIGATAVWRVRPSGSNTNGGGYDPGIAGASTDYSQQNAAQASGSAGTATGTAVFIDTVAAAFTAAMVGNAIWIASGAGFTVGAYFVISRQSATQVTLDRSPGTGTVAVWKLGGGWADPITNCTNAVASQIPVAGNIIYILGSGTPNPAAYTYDYSITSALNGGAVVGSATLGLITFANDPSTPGYKAPPDTTGGMPVIQTIDRFLTNSSYTGFSGLYFVTNATGATFASFGVLHNVGASMAPIFGCVCDQFGNDAAFVRISNFNLIGSEIFSSVTPGSNGTQSAINLGSANIHQSNIHDTVGNAVTQNTANQTNILGSIIAKCRGWAVKITIGSSTIIGNNTVDGNIGNAMEFADQSSILQACIYNNIVSNHTQVSTFGLVIDAGTATQNTQLVSFADYNSFYNNTTNYSAINAGSHDTALGVNPYVGQATENYTLA